MQSESKRIAETEAETAKLDNELETLHKLALAEKEGTNDESIKASETVDVGTAWYTVMGEARKRVSF